MIESMSEPQPDYDSPWKDILERFFRQFLQFFFPAVHDGIDWNREYTFLDKEFQKLTRDAEVGRRFADKLVQVYTRDGEPLMVMIHIEVQGGYEADFAKRMYVYNYRIYDRFEHQVISLAALTDDSRTWRPASFGWQRWGFSLAMNFPMVKLLDYNDPLALERNPNPFAIVTLAHLKVRETRKDSLQRYEWKWRIIRALYERGYTKQEIIDLFLFIDWIMILPKELDERFAEQLTEYQEEVKMKYVSSVERLGMKKGKLENAREMVTEALAVRFSAIPEHILASISQVENPDSLKCLLKQAILTPSIEQFEAEFQNCAA